MPSILPALRDKLDKLGIGDVQMQSVGARNEVLIRVEQQPGGDAEQQVALKKVTDALAGHTRNAASRSWGRPSRAS